MRRFMKTVSLLGLLGFSMIALTGCEWGHEVAVVDHADASRLSDDRVRVRATLGCGLEAGMGRDGHGCDADKSTICVHARWFAGDDTKREHPLSAADVCAYIGDVKNFTFELVSHDPVPRESSLVVFTSDQRKAQGTQGEDVIITSP